MVHGPGGGGDWEGAVQIRWSSGIRTRGRGQCFVMLMGAVFCRHCYQP